MKFEIVHKELKNGDRLTKIYYQNILIRWYKYPTITNKFSSKLINYENLELLDSFQEDCIYQVLNKLKPMGTLLETNKEAIPKIESEIKSHSGIKYKISDNAGWSKRFTEILVAIDSTFENLLDMDSLIKDYSEYFSLAGFSHEFLQDVIVYLNSLRYKSISDFFDYDYANPQTVFDLITTGLILGYPIETTASLIIKDFL